MIKFKFICSALLIGTLGLSSCKKNKNVLTLDIDGLENLGSDYAYEGWIIVDGKPITTGVFHVDDNGNLSETKFELKRRQLRKATRFVLTIEPFPDPDPDPSSLHIIAGDFSGDEAILNIEHESALKTNFSSATGKYILATPTDGNSTTDENSGVWFLNNGSAGLSLPSLPSSWEYEGWAVINGTPVSTGKFTSVSSSDKSSTYSGSSAGPNFPGEDFLQNAPSGLTFPTDLSDQKIVISVEPIPDNSPNPFSLKPLAADVPSNATDQTIYTMSNNSSNTNPTGFARK